MAALVVVAAVACRGVDHPDVITPRATEALPAHRAIALDASPKAKRRGVPAEVVLRAFLGWFGDLTPQEAFARARGNDLFEPWSAYLAALGLPDHHVDAPRVSQSNTVMLATIGRLAEALCIRSVERDLHARAPLADRIIFGFDATPSPSLQSFTIGFDVLHRTFLGYPAALAPAPRIERFYGLYRSVATRPASRLLTSDELAWAAVCTALVQHPETWLY